MRWLGMIAFTGLLAATLAAQEPAEPKKTTKKGTTRRSTQEPGKGERVEKEKTKAREGVALPEDFTKTVNWRSIGPANMGGRITALAVYEADPLTFWVATASGGLLKTTNGGINFIHQFDKEATVSIGDVAVAPSDKNIVWVGTGEANPRNSVSYGDGVYKSVDGGKTWTNMGLKETFQIGKICIHPKDPNIVYVGALGRLYGKNAERGLFKTTDGGKTWNKIFYIDEDHGVIDMRLDPNAPDTLFVAMWSRKRDEFDSFVGEPAPDGVESYGPIRYKSEKGGIYKTSDGGKTFKKLSNGLPSNPTGRIGLDMMGKDSKVLFAIIDCEKIGQGTARKGATTYMGITGTDNDDPEGAKLTRIVADGPAAKAGLLTDDVIIKVDGVEVGSYSALREAYLAKKVDDKIEIEYRRGNDTKKTSLTLAALPVQPGTPAPKVDSKRPYAAQYFGQLENVQDLQGPNSHEYGGVYKSTDSGETWKRINSINPRPMYFSVVRTDPSDDQRLYVLGVSMSRSTNGGKTFRSNVSGIHADQHCLWIDPKDGRKMILGCDGGVYVSNDFGNNWDHINTTAISQFYHVGITPGYPYMIGGGLQDNGTWGAYSVGQRGITGPINEDWLSLNGGDGFVTRFDPTDPDIVYVESQNGRISRRNLKTSESASISPRPAQGAKPYRFNWNTPFILSNHNSRIIYTAGEYVFRSLNRGDTMQIISPEITRTKRGSGTALSESPLNANVVWAGTDDGYVWVTKDGGKEWKNVTQAIGLPKPLWVSTIEASRYAEGRAYVCFDGHRSDTEAPFIYVTEDYGATWKPIVSNLPTGSTRCLREDLFNPNLLYCGTEFALYASTDRGVTWRKINNNLPTVAIHEIAQHPTCGEIVLATHGRGIWIGDATPLRQVYADVVKAEEPQFLKANVLPRLAPKLNTGRTNRRFVGTNPSNSVGMFYLLPKKAEAATLSITDLASGRVLTETKVPTSVGLHRQTWDQSVNGRLVPPGLYRAVLKVDGKEYPQLLKIEGPALPSGRGAAEDDDEENDDDVIR